MNLCQLIGDLHGLQQPEKQLRGIGSARSNIISGVPSQKPGNGKCNRAVQHGEKAVRGPAEGLTAATGAGDHQVTKVKSIQIDETGAVLQYISVKLHGTGKTSLFVNREDDPKRDVRPLRLQKIHNGGQTDTTVCTQ